MQKFKKIMKAQAKNSLVYWVEHEGNHFIGSRHFIIRLQTVTSDMRKVLGECGLFESNTACDMGKSITPPNVHKIMPEPGTTYNWPEVEWLPLQSPYDKNSTMQVGIRENDVIYSNVDYLEAMDELFTPSDKKAPKQVWKQEKQFGALCLGNSLAIVLPYRVNEDTPVAKAIKQLQNLKRLESVK